jgi:hypothetical protein
MEPTVVLFICLALVVVCLVMVWLALRAAAQAKLAAAKAEKQVKALEAKLSAFDVRLTTLEEQERDKTSDVLGLVDAVTGFKTRGWLPSLGLMAYRLYLSYSKGRKPGKALSAKAKK